VVFQTNVFVSVSSRRTRTNPRSLLEGAVSHYEDAAYYTETYADRTSDIDFYVERVTALGKSVLDLGCGNGRMAIPLAHMGMRVAGVDASRPMLADLARKQAKSKPPLALEATEGDIRDVRLGSRFDVVLSAFNTVLHLYTRDDVERFCQTVHAHLRKGGTFLCDLSVPSPKDLSRKPSRAYAAEPFTHPSLGPVLYQERFGYAASSQVLQVEMEFQPKRGAMQTSTLTHRQFFPEEWRALLHYNGFRVNAEYGDWDGSSFTDASDVMIVECTVRA
jgi:SAM-dependent methyltransferase